GYAACAFPAKSCAGTLIAATPRSLTPPPTRLPGRRAHSFDSGLRGRQTVPRCVARPTAVPYLRALCDLAGSVERSAAAIASRFYPPCNKDCELVDARTGSAEPVLR